MSLDNIDNIEYFGSSTTYNAYANNVDLKLVDNVIFRIPDTPNFTGKPAISIAIGLVPSQQSFTADTFIAEIIETDNTVLQLLKTKVGVVASNEYPQVNEIVWFDVEGMQGEFWVHESWKGKILKISGKFETASITAEVMNKLKKEIADVVNVIKMSAPPIGATYTQWNINAPTPKTKWSSTTWQVVSTKKVFIKEITFTNPVQNATHWLDNNTTAIECDCIGGGGGSGGGSNGANGSNSIVNYNGSVITGTGGGGGRGGGYGDRGPNGTGSATNGTGGGGASGGGYGCQSVYGRGGNGTGGTGGIGGGDGTKGGDGYGNNGGTGGTGGIGGKGSGLQYSYTGFNIISSVRNLTYTVGSGGNSSIQSGSAGVVAIREFTTETVYVRTA